MRRAMIVVEQIHVIPLYRDPDPTLDLGKGSRKK